MKTRYYKDPDCSSMTTRIISTREKGENWEIELEDTLFYPEGGGQPADRGTLGGQPLLDVQKKDNRILHYCAAAPEKGEVELILDIGFRDHYCAQHTGQHLISSLLDKRGAATVSVHMGEEECGIELEGHVLTSDEIAEVENEANAQIRAALPVRSLWLSTADELSAYDLRGSTDKTEDIRLIEIEGIDVNPCGGIHVKNTARLGLIKYTGQEKKRGRQRLVWKIGGPAYRDYARRFDQTAAISGLLSVHPYDTARRTAEILEEKKEENRMNRLLTETEAEAAGKVLASSICCYPPLIVKEIPAGSPEYFRALVKYLSSEEGISFLVCAKDGERLNWALHLPRHKEFAFDEFKSRCLSLINGKGGGKGPLWQGSGSKAGESSAFLSEFRVLAGV